MGWGDTIAWILVILSVAALALMTIHLLGDD